MFGGVSEDTVSRFCCLRFFLSTKNAAVNRIAKPITTYNIVFET